MSLRFAGLIGDFNENHNQPLSENEKNLLLNNCIAQIEKLHEKYREKKVLVCSDSITLLEMTKNLGYVFVTDGKPVHSHYIRKEDQDMTDENNLKTFVDFFLIAGADEIFLLLSGDMYPSGFPSIAARVYDRPFEIIRF